MLVLVTGASGFLGRIICQKFTSNIKTLGRASFSDICSDLSKEIPKLFKFDLVIHAAGKAHSVPKSDIEKNQFYAVNVDGTVNLLKGLEKTGLPKMFVFISSVSVYGQESGINITENHPLEAKDPYGLSKIEAERIILLWCKLNNVVCTILRLPLLVGENPPGNLGTMLKGIEKGYYFNIAGGKAKKSMVMAQDVANFISKVAAVGGIYNLTDGLHPNFSELSTAISKQKKKKTPLNLPLFIAKLLGYSGDIFGDNVPINSSKIRKITSDLTFDDSKARELVGWQPQSVLQYLKSNSL